ncbi:tryptophan 2,3-dioxygenase family protein [Streptomyces sp. NBC_00838]|uniref:tryptophan 2,3-dioxygenase family protein n=1 Tax=Streptomyces sp. NBC_00838 TaxID=2903680 RepID=UPI003870D25F|nr:tryptophan 2,3-dioxygenase family protein [Streptomyces sp. NBC_00838]
MALSERTVPAAGETAEPPASYRDHLRLDALLPAVRTDTDPYTAIFLVPHQGCEIHFKLILKLIREAGDALAAGDGELAADMVRPLAPLMTLVTDEFDVLAKLPVEKFELIRKSMGTASGIQSAQWRAVEYACGQRDERHLHTRGFTAAEHAMLRQQLTATSIVDHYTAFAATADSPSHTALVREIRTDLAAFGGEVSRWRDAHVAIAKRLLRERPGTGGTTGVDYLRAAADRPIFPELTSHHDPEEGRA